LTKERKPTARTKKPNLGQLRGRGKATITEGGAVQVRKRGGDERRIYAEPGRGDPQQTIDMATQRRWAGKKRV